MTVQELFKQGDVIIRYARWNYNETDVIETIHTDINDIPEDRTKEQWYKEINNYLEATNEENNNTTNIFNCI